VLTPYGEPGIYWAAQIVTFEEAFSGVPWTLQNRAIRGAAISFRGPGSPSLPPRNASTAYCYGGVLAVTERVKKAETAMKKTRYVYRQKVTAKNSKKYGTLHEFECHPCAL